MYIGFVSSKGSKNWGHRLISFFTGSEICHTFSMFKLNEYTVGGGDKTVYRVYETSETTFEEQTLSHRLDGTPVPYIFEVSDDKIDSPRSLIQALTFIGRPYDYPFFAALGLMLAAEWILNLCRQAVMLDPIKLQHGSQAIDSRMLFCTESVILIARAGGLEIPINRLAPSDLLEFCLSNPETFRNVTDEVIADNASRS